LYLAAIIPPNNAETAVMAVKREIFRETSALSSWALKPMIPFMFFSGEPGKLIRKDLPALPLGGLTVDKLSQINGQYILGSEQCSAFCSELKSLFDGFDDCTPGLNGLHIFDCTDVEYASHSQILNVAENHIKTLDHSVTHWRSCSLSVFRLETELFAASGWWKRVVLETLQEISFLKNPAQ
jgi:hypothetical protein